MKKSIIITLALLLPLALCAEITKKEDINKDNLYKFRGSMTQYEDPGVTYSKAPKGFTKWKVPAFDYLYAFAEMNKLNTIHDILDYAAENGWEIIGSPFDFMPPDSQNMVLFFPVKKMED